MCIGITEIDKQYMVLVAMHYELAAAIQGRNSSTTAVAILGRLAEYAHVHFAVEESMMRLLAYPDYEAHKNCHEELIEQLKELQSNVFREKKAVNFEQLHFLRMWLVKHIQETDSSYAKHFCENSVSTSKSNNTTTPFLASI